MEAKWSFWADPDFIPSAILEGVMAVLNIEGFFGTPSPRSLLGPFQVSLGSFSLLFLLAL